MRNHYWTCSKFADWLRGTPSPGALTSRGWREWREKAESAHPVRYWLADDGLDYLQRFVFYIPDQHMTSNIISTIDSLLEPTHSLLTLVILPLVSGAMLAIVSFHVFLTNLEILLK